MAHFAEINENNIVLRVVVTDNDDPNGDEGYQWLVDNLGGAWVKTSFNGTIRKQFAGTGYTYNADADVFVSPKPFESWTLDENFDWQPPVAKPKGACYWDEETLNWVEEPAE
jgi:hypothetical protein